METVLNYLKENNFKQVGDFKKCHNLQYYYFYNLTFSHKAKDFYLTKYTKKFGRFLYQKKFKTFAELKLFLEKNILP